MKIKVITLLIFGLIITGTTLSQNIPNDIPKAFKTGDVQCLEKYMEDKILLTISGIKQQLPRPKAKSAFRKAPPAPRQGVEVALPTVRRRAL